LTNIPWLFIFLARLINQLSKEKQNNV